MCVTIHVHWVHTVEAGVNELLLCCRHLMPDQRKRVAVELEELARAGLIVYIEGRSSHVA
ncbi:hypothetical protein NTGHW29_340008 [Candidatus Nitrotoga sp. HW29]|uniref:hypothetical protein n=1 Tax=Candidatus Nitrotoga sp. HW29 TaxID=2886963 RepID=UPI001EF35B07|nr:hypothetical protein [Candidatus Nitrotoga sp. HW29]CAH1904599.1 hypothetical protein NTGHW29_340008 [Candidatus Nitrotoga sp. HW29]